MANKLMNDLLYLRGAVKSLEKMAENDLRKMLTSLKGWSGTVAHPRSPAVIAHLG
jgi:hypothetical protein